jgi:hypothetical protein
MLPALIIALLDAVIQMGLCETCFNSRYRFSAARASFSAVIARSEATKQSSAALAAAAARIASLRSQ